MAINAEHQAEELAKDLDLVLPINPISVCSSISTSSFQVEYIERPFGENICGISVGCQDQAEIIVNSNIINSRRRLFTAAHEIGHVVLHIQTGKELNFKCFEKDLRETISQERKMEVEANQFAAALLMPRHLIEKKIRQEDLTWHFVQKIALQCHTSLEATARRIIKITKESFALIIHEHNEMWTPVKSNSFSLPILKSLFPKNLKAKNYQEENINKIKLKKCTLADWGIEQKNGQYNCYYSSIYFEKNKRIMTLLFIEEIDEHEIENLAWEEPHF